MSVLVGSITSLFQLLVCGSTIYLSPNEPYTLRSALYPLNYLGAIPFNCSVRFDAPDDYFVRSTCNVEFPYYNSYCTGDRLEFTHLEQTGDPDRYCGSNSKVQVDSTIDRIEIAFIKPVANVAGGRFTCTIEAIPQVCKCGRRNSFARIDGGEETREHEFPMMAGVINRNGGTIRCGGTIINQRTIVTSASCVYEVPIYSLAVLVGKHHIDQQDAFEQTYLVVKIFQHEKFAMLENDKLFDIALVFTDRTMIFNYGVGAACLPYRYENANIADMTVEALGWGNNAIGVTTKFLRKVSLQVASAQQCESEYPVDSTVLCTLGDGDAGGPLLYTDDQSIVYLFGVIGGGHFCAASIPSYNAKVMSYLKWIEERTQQTGPCAI